MRLSIERMADTGEGIARWPDGRICFVEGALPTEIVEADLVEEHRRRVRARVSAVVEAAPERIAPDCAVAGRCGGCDWRMLSPQQQCELRRRMLQQRLAHHGFDIEVPRFLPSGGCRNRVQVQHRAGEWGFLERRSRRIVAVRQCPATDPALADVIDAFAASCPELNDRLRWRRDERGSVSVIAGRDLPAGNLWPRLDAAGVAGAIIARRRRGDPDVHYTVEGCELVAPGDAFTQVNLTANRQLVAAVIAAVGPAQCVLDLFCGVGNLSLPLAARGIRTIGAEQHPVAVDAAQANAARNGLTPEVAQFLRRDLHRAGAVADLFAAGTVPDVVILDPPRSGARTAVRELTATAVERVVLVSCDPATALRDLLVLREGGFTLQDARLVDMFPGTAHVEAVFTLQR